MENYLVRQAAVARPPLAVMQSHAMLRLVHRCPVAALEGAVTRRIGRFVRGAADPLRARQPRFEPAASIGPKLSQRPAPSLHD